MNAQTKMIQVGDDMPVLELPPISRTTLALFAGASGDHNPIHVDIDFARSAGQRDVFAHGMLSAAWLARVLTDWVPPTALRSYQVRFAAITHVGDRIRCSGEVAEKRDDLRQVRLTLSTRNQEGELKLAGEAWVALP